MIEISVVIALFGTHRGWETISTVVQSWLDQDISCEVVIATDVSTHCEGVIGGRASQRIRIVNAPMSESTRGRLNNFAAEHSRGEWLYITDADVAPLGRDFLRRAFAAVKMTGGFLAQPRMLRLTGPSPIGVPSQWAAPSDIEGVCFVRAGEDGRLAPHTGESVFVWSDFDGQLWVDPPPDLGESGEDEFYRRPALHWGSVLVRRAKFMEVGGYCARYEGWGCEDEDLLEKLKARSAMTSCWRQIPDLICLHFEHARAGETPEYAANVALLERRRDAGPEAMIDDDLGVVGHIRVRSSKFERRR